MDALWSCCFLSSVPPPSFTSDFHTFFSKREVGGEETPEVLLTKPSMCCWHHLNPGLSFQTKAWLNMELWNHEESASGRGVSLMHQAGEMGSIKEGIQLCQTLKTGILERSSLHLYLKQQICLKGLLTLGCYRHVLFGHQIHGNCDVYCCWGTSHNMLHVASHTSRLLFLISKITFLWLSKPFTAWALNRVTEWAITK